MDSDKRRSGVCDRRGDRTGLLILLARERDTAGSIPAAPTTSDV
jgi:hypothetical protein